MGGGIRVREFTWIDVEIFPDTTLIQNLTRKKGSLQTTPTKAVVLFQEMVMILGLDDPFYPLKFWSASR